MLKRALQLIGSMLTQQALAEPGITPTGYTRPENCRLFPVPP